jgi:hypothetical protein
MQVGQVLKLGFSWGADQSRGPPAARRKKLAHNPESAPGFFIQIYISGIDELEDPEAGQRPAHSKLRGNVKTKIPVRREVSEIASGHMSFPVNGSS